MTLQATLDTIKVELKAHLSAELATIADRTMKALIASGQAARALKVGDRAPSFNLPDQSGLMVSSAALLETGPVVVSFYRGVWCPFCNAELKALQEALDSIEARGASLVAISQQTLSNNGKSRRENKVTFPLLRDNRGEIGAAFGLRWVLPEDMRDLHRKLGGPLPVFNGEDSWTLPMPARYVIDRDGVLAYAEVNPDYTQRPEPSDLLPVLDRLNAVAAL